MKFPSQPGGAAAKYFMLKVLFRKSDGDLSNIFTIFVFSVLACVPIFLSGIPNSADMAQHFQFAVTFYDSVKDGIWYPSLAHLTNTGFGDVGVRFYPPFSYYVLILFRALSGEWFYASCAAFCFWFFTSGVGIYLWAKEWFSNRASAFAAIIYIFIPYHVNELYNSFLYAEFAASAVLPFCFLFVTRICRPAAKNSDILGLAIAYALLILTNLPLALIGSLSLLVYALASLDRKTFFNRALKLAAAVCLGLLASSFYWLKMLLEINFVKHNTAQFTLDRYDFHTNFAFSYFFIEAGEEALRTLWYLDTLMLLTLGVFLPSIIIFYRFRRSNEFPRLFNVLILLILALFLASVPSEKVWENIPLLQKIQFPWRWLAIISMCGVIFNAAVFEDVIKFYHSEKRWLAMLVGGLIAAAFAFTGIKIMRPVYQHARADFNPMVERLRTGGSYECWMPVWVKNEELADDPLSLAERPRAVVSNQQTEKLIRFPAGKPVRTPIRTFYYPHWQASANNQKIEVGRADNGTVLLNIPPEETIIKLEFVEPPYVKTANFISVFVWLFFLGAAGFLLLPAARLKLSELFSDNK